MREIKFRAWCARDSEMRIGYYVSDGVHHEIMTLLPSGELYASAIRSEDLDTLGQFTGLLDKEGKEIYEGDVIHYVGYGNYTVVWDGDSGCWDTDLIGRCTEMFLATNLFECSCDPVQHEAEVLGNIYENPELKENQNGNKFKREDA